METLNIDKKVKSEETASRILNQAVRLFLEKGYHGTSIDDITQAAGLTKGALYWHFEGKEARLERIIDEFEKRYLNKMILVVGAVKGGALDKFEKYIRFNSAFAYYNRKLVVSFTALAAGLVGAHHAIEAKIRRIYKKYQKFLVDLISHGKSEKVFRKQIDPTAFWPLLLKTLPPEQNRRAGRPQFFCDAIVGDPLRCKQADPRSQNDSLRRGLSAYPSLQSLPLFRTHWQRLFWLPHESHFGMIRSNIQDLLIH